MNLFNISIGTASSAPQTWATTILPSLTVALVAGIVLFLLNWTREYLTSYWKKESEAEVLAFSLATQFDQFISQCTNVVDDPLHEDPETGCYQSTTKIPQIIFADITNWSVLDKRLQYKIRSIPNKIDVAERNLESIWENGEGPPYYGDMFEERVWRYAWIGLEACLINDILKEKYDVPQLERGEWHPADHFKNEIDRIAKQREDANNWPKPDWMFPKVPIEELQERHAKFAVDLEAAKTRRAVQ